MTETSKTVPDGEDTATGTDPDAKYETPGYEDKSFGQAVSEDAELVDELVEDTDGDLAEAEVKFEDAAVGAPAREKQGEIETS